jgi:hypothetical protein
MAELTTMTADDPAGDDEHEKPEPSDAEEVGETDPPCRESSCHGKEFAHSTSGR